MRRFPRHAHVIAIVALGCALSACSSGKPDYAKLEASISDEIDESFASFDTSATSVDCPEQDNLDVGTEFICQVELTDLDGDMRVTVEVMTVDLDVEFETLDLLYDMRVVETAISEDQTAALGSEVTVDCGEERLQAIEGGASFDCTATDVNGDTAAVDVVTDNEGNISWTVTPDES